MNIFDILGPVMVGPSSSHTAGAVRIGYVTRTMLGEEPVNAMISLSGSFAATGSGHGTDRALIAGGAVFFFCKYTAPRGTSEYGCTGSGRENRTVNKNTGILAWRRPDYDR